MASETCAFSDGSDDVFALTHDCNWIYQNTIPITMHTDSKQLFDALTQARKTIERRLMIDLAYRRKTDRSHDLGDLHLVRVDSNPADELRKL